MQVKTHSARGTRSAVIAWTISTAWLSVTSFAWAGSSPSFQGLGDLPGGSFSSRANGISADGSVVVGRGWSEPSFEAFLWAEAGGLMGLGDLPGGITISSAIGVSSDGRVVVGISDSASGGEA
ncbi:MAG: PEP-CTERM sorting domain-containing protein, partial [Phycisphaerae bacterium]